MLDTNIRDHYQKIFITPFLKLKFIKNINPHFITFVALTFGIFAFFFIISDHKYLAVSCIVLSGYFDTLDGSIARLNNQESNLGSVFDIFSDRFVEMLIILALFLIDPTSRAFLSFFMIAGCYLFITSFLVVGIFEKNLGVKSFHYSSGIIERSEAFIFFISMILFPNIFSFLAFCFSVLVTATSFIRIYEFYKKSKLKKSIDLDTR